MTAPTYQEVDWSDALCAQTDPDAFFPEHGDPAGYGNSVEAAKRVCRLCPLQADCLDYALANDERYGVWGGTSERDRSRLRSHRKAR